MDGSMMSEPHFPFRKPHLPVETEWTLSPLKPKTRMLDFMFGAITTKDYGLNPFLRSLVILAILLALSGAIYSQIAHFCCSI